MSSDWSCLALFAVGQAGVLAVVVVNVTHALGLRERMHGPDQGPAARPDARHDGGHRLGGLAGSRGRPGRGPRRPTRWPAWRSLSWACPLVHARPHLPAAAAGHLGPRPRRSTWPQTDGTEALIGTGKHAWMLRLPGNESFRLRKREWDVALPEPPRRLGRPEPGPAQRPALRPVLSAAGSSKPCSTRRRPWEADLVLFTGDLVDDDAAIDWIVPLLSRLRGPAREVRDPGQPRLRAPPRQDPPGAGRGRLHRPGRALDDARASRARPWRSAGPRPPGAPARPGADARGRLPDPAQPLARPVPPGRAVGDRPDALGPQPRRPGPPPAGRPGLHAEPLLAPVRPRLLPRRAGPSCTSARASPASTRSATAACPRSAGSRSARPVSAGEACTRVVSSRRGPEELFQNNFTNSGCHRSYAVVDVRDPIACGLGMSKQDTVRRR